MDYREFPHSREKISTIGIGGANLTALSDEEAKRVFDHALESGINILDMATDNVSYFSKVRKALGDRRDKIMISLHLGMTFQEDGQYMRVKDIDLVRQAFEKQLSALGTDYADIAYIHYVDALEDYDWVVSSGILDYAKQLKRDGHIRRLGFGSHRADMSRKLLDTGEFDLFLFSINPAYDMDPVTHNPLEEDLSSLNSLTVAQERIELYRQAERLGVGITVMKPLGAGILLDAKTSPFGRALTTRQCIQYCLDRPGVLSCMIGLQSVEQLKGLLAYYDATPEEKDYSFIADMQPAQMLGKCVYCNHCLPCPANIKIGSVHKFIDLAQAGDELARQHYLDLEHTAEDCIECGSCEDNCPFKVAVREKMKEAAKLFGR